MESIFRMDGAGIEAACMGIVDSIKSYLLTTRLNGSSNAEGKISDEGKYPLLGQVSSADMFKLCIIYI